MNHHKSETSSLLASLRAALTEMRHPARLSALGLGALAPLAALANPTGGQVVGGSATISTPSANATVINQSSQRAAIDWQQFSVGTNQYVQFVQPNSSAVVLNRVIGSNPSSIFGNITANGQVFLVNPNGILFAPGATLDVAGLVASTLDVSNADFMQGKYVFSAGAGTAPGVVQNQGSITASRGGYVVLAGDYVENDGQINAQTGRVYLAAGNSATLTFDKNQLISYAVNGATLARLAGVTNTGEITADGGAVVMTADVGNALIATAVNNSGFVAAHSIQNESGTIVLAAAGGGIENSGTLDASAAFYAGNAPGGEVIIRGNERTQLTPTSVIDAAGGGTGKGGFIELSGHTLSVHGTVDAGKGGNLLLDPQKIAIHTGTNHTSVTNGTGSVGTGFITAALNLGQNVTLVASNSITNSGATVLNATTGAGNLKMEIGTTLPTSCGGIGGICVNTTPTITPGNGTITLTGLTINIKGTFTAIAGKGTVTLGDVTAQSILVTGGNINTGNLHAIGTTVADGIALRASNSSTAFSSGQIHVTGNLIADHGSVNISAAGGGDSGGGMIQVTGNISALNGSALISDRYLGTCSCGGPQMTLGNVAAAKRIAISTTGPNAVLQVGAITGAHIDISASGKHETITTGALTATSANGSADIHLDEFIQSGGSGAINVNGNITVSGKANHTYGALSNFGLPVAAGLFINAGGSGSADVRSVKINGAVNVTAQAGSYHAGSCECGVPVSPRHLQHGTGGAAVAFITVAGSHGAASVTGNLSAKGPDAFVGVQAHSVQVHNVSVTGSGHHVTRSLGPNTLGDSYASSNSAGQANLILGQVPPLTSYGGIGISATVKAGNITVSGKGVADAALFASNVSAGNVSVVATAADGKITSNKGNVILTCGTGICANQNSSNFYDHHDPDSLHLGSIHMGIAGIEVGAGATGGGSGSGQQAVNVRLGNLNVNGVGHADIVLDAKAVNTQALTAVATQGTEKGTGSSQSGVTAVNTYTHTFNVNGGDARIKIRSGGSGSRSSGVLTLNGGPVTIGGNVTVTGPTADVDVKAKSVKIGGTVTVTGSGGSSTEKTVFTPAAGTGYTTSFNGSEPIGLNLQGAISGSVSVAGKTTIKGPGLVGAIAVGGTVKLHGFSGSASAVKNYSVLDTRVSPTALNFAAGSLVVIVSDVAASGGKPVFTAASDTGDMKFSAKGDVDLATRVNVNGTVLVEAVGSIFGTSHGAVGHFNSIDAAHPHANSGGGRGGPSPGVLPASALQANAMAMVAQKGITLTGTQLNIGTGSISSVHGDSTLIAGLAVEGLAPASVNPNGAFIAGGAVTLGNLQLTGSYLLLQGSAVSVLGKVTAPKGTLVQVEPFDLTLPIDIEDSTLLKSVLGSAALTQASGSTSFGLTNASFLSLFGGDTVAVGGTGVSGDVTIGANGPLNLGDTNLIIFTTGNITGLGTVTSTGIVQSLLSILGPAVPPVTAGEVDPTAGSGTNTGLGDATDKRKIGGGGDEGDNQQPAGTVSQDSGNASVCH